jgi:hypothetical protein
MTILVVALTALAGGIAGAAVADHQHKNALMGPANVASWYCQNRGQRCEEPQAEAVEAAWQRRELIYRISFCAASLGAMTALVLRLRRRTPDGAEVDLVRHRSTLPPG